MLLGILSEGKPPARREHNAPTSCALGLNHLKVFQCIPFRSRSRPWKVQ
nr:MAG TPA: hypothetical protein [Caudoviricetes sp.]